MAQENNSVLQDILDELKRTNKGQQTLKDVMETVHFDINHANKYGKKDDHHQDYTHSYDKSKREAAKATDNETVQRVVYSRRGIDKHGDAAIRDEIEKFYKGVKLATDGMDTFYQSAKKGAVSFGKLLTNKDELKKKIAGFKDGFNEFKKDPLGKTKAFAQKIKGAIGTKADFKNQFGTSINDPDEIADKPTTISGKLGKAMGHAFALNSDVDLETRREYARENIHNDKVYDRALKGDTTPQQHEIDELTRDYHRNGIAKKGKSLEQHINENIGDLVAVNNRKVLFDRNPEELKRQDTEKEESDIRESNRKKKEIRTAEEDRYFSGERNILPHEEEQVKSIQKEYDLGKELPPGITKEAAMNMHKDNIIASANERVKARLDSSDRFAEEILKSPTNKGQPVVSDFVKDSVIESYKNAPSDLGNIKNISNTDNITNTIGKSNENIISNKNNESNIKNISNTDNSIGKSNESNIKNISNTDNITNSIDKSPEINKLTIDSAVINNATIKNQSTKYKKADTKEPKYAKPKVASPVTKLDNTTPKSGGTVSTASVASVASASLEPKKTDTSSSESQKVAPEEKSDSSSLVSDVASAAGGTILGKAGSIGKGLLKGASKVALPLAALSAGYDAVTGYNKASENLDIQGRDATFGEKMSSAAGSIASGLTFGLVDEKSASKGIAGFFGAGSDLKPNQSTQIAPVATNDVLSKEMDTNMELKSEAENKGNNAPIVIQNSTNVSGGGNNAPVVAMTPSSVRPNHSAYERFVDRTFNPV